MTIKNEKADEGKRDESGASEEAANNDLWGSDMYPERRGAKIKHTWLQTLLCIQQRESIDKNKCENNVYQCVQDSKTSLSYLEGNRKRSDANLFSILQNVLLLVLF